MTTPSPECEYCGKKLEPPKRRYCSGKCSSAHWREKFFDRTGVNYTTEQQRDKRKQDKEE